jgi:hypothetical protein
MNESHYAVLSRSLDAARERFAGYRSECVLFAATLSRGFMEYAGWPRELVSYEHVAEKGAGKPTQKIEDAMHLDADAFWHFVLRLGIEGPKGKDAIPLEVKFKKLETRYIISLFGAGPGAPFEDFELAAPTPEALQPIYDSIVNAVKRYYDYGLRLFLENGGRGLKIPISSERLLDLARR